jgi:hypothetical protein
MQRKPLGRPPGPVLSQPKGNVLFSGLSGSSLAGLSTVEWWRWSVWGDFAQDKKSTVEHRSGLNADNTIRTTRSIPAPRKLDFSISVGSIDTKNTLSKTSNPEAFAKTRQNWVGGKNYIVIVLDVCHVNCSNIELVLFSVKVGYGWCVHSRWQ